MTTYIGTTTASHANDDAVGLNYDITNSNGFKRYYPNKTDINLATALDLITFSALNGVDYATESTDGITQLASEADMNLINVNGGADAVLDVITVKQLQYWVNTVAPATNNKNGFVKLATTLKRNSADTGVISVKALNDFMSDVDNNANETTASVVKIADSNEAIAGTNDVKAMTPLKVKLFVSQTMNAIIPTDATTSVIGSTYLATGGEAIAGTINTNKAMTPKTSKDAFNNWIANWVDVSTKAVDANDVPSYQETQNDISVAMQTAITDAVQQALDATQDYIVPIGGIIMLKDRASFDALNTLKWKECDGDNGTYDMRGRSPVGFDASNNLFDTDGKLGGFESITHEHNVTVKSHRLTEYEMPSHQHATSGAGGKPGSHAGFGHARQYGSRHFGLSSADYDNYLSWSSPTGNNWGHSHEAECGWINITNMQPFRTVIYAMRIA